MPHSPLTAAAVALTLALLVLIPLASAAAGGTPAKTPAKAAAAPPAPAPPNITALMSKGGCKAFASLLTKSPDALSTFQSAVVGGGVTAFCPTDDAVRGFMPSYRNLTADGKASLLLFHAVPVYYTLRGLKSSNGPMNTLATDGGGGGGGGGSFNLTVQNSGDQVTLSTPVSDGEAAARVRSTVYDRDPVAIYAVDAVLEPVELFDAVEAPAPAPAPVADAPSPAAAAAAKRTRHHRADAPGPAADDASTADQRKDSSKNAAAAAPCRTWWLAAVAVVVAAGLAAY